MANDRPRPPTRTIDALIGTSRGLAHLAVAAVAWLLTFGTDSPLRNDAFKPWLSTILVTAIGISGVAIVAVEPRWRALGIVLGVVLAVCIELLVLLTVIVANSA